MLVANVLALVFIKFESKNPSFCSKVDNFYFFCNIFLTFNVFMTVCIKVSITAMFLKILLSFM